MEAIPLPTQFNPRLPGTEIAPGSEGAAPAVLRLRRQRPAQGRPPVRPLRYRWYPRCKYAADFALALALSAVALPLVALAALLVKLSSRGPAFYTQTRVGQDGRLFAIYKLRTMVHNCESLTGPRWSLPGDPRVTRVGQVLRATHLDELPQLLNVLRGEMSLIGPRPERPEFVPELERALPGYWQRLTVRPGVTGLAQVQLPPDSDVTSVRRKLAHDLYYIERLGPWLDLRILFCTALYALGLPFDRLSWLVGTPGREAIERAMSDDIGDAESPAARRSA
jgi:lipopolysaccharide/colanic/teichoic acid biosynthesis glycosyltransferase